MARSITRSLQIDNENDDDVVVRILHYVQTQVLFGDNVGWGCFFLDTTCRDNYLLKY